MKNDDASDRNITQKAKQQFDQQADHLDEATVKKLDNIRCEAITAAGKQPSLFSSVIQQIQQIQQVQAWQKPAIALSIVGLCVYLGLVNTTPSASLPDNTLDMVLINEDYDLLHEDIEFYLWLENQAQLDTQQDNTSTQSKEII
ncbi:MAG: hypothetical protein HRU20_00085 [Pseudomonadales bacterium]|nr:hypothetical protein [Pseudomonadales bacterium]